MPSLDLPPRNSRLVASLVKEEEDIDRASASQRSQISLP
jgi:hypothetical protein